MNRLLQGYFSLIRKLIPEKGVQASFGLDIGSGECKLVEVIKDDDGSYHINNCYVETVQNGNIPNAIQKILEKLDNACDVPYTAVSGRGTLIRHINMPKMTLKDLRNSFGIEADKYFPFAQDQIYTDCYILDSDGENNQMSVMAAASKKELVDERMKMLAELGLQSEFITLNAVALGNVIGLMEGSKENDVVALLDIGESVSSLSIYQNNKPWFTRDIFLGGRDFSKRISNVLGVDFEEAEKLKRDPKEKKNEVISACEAAVLNIVQELKLSFDYFATEKDSEIKKMFITGGASMLENLDKTLEKNLEISVETLNPFPSFIVEKNISEEQLNQMSSKLVVALGLALSHYD